jgi:hypothetical protein
LLRDSSKKEKLPAVQVAKHKYQIVSIEKEEGEVVNVQIAFKERSMRDG